MKNLRSKWLVLSALLLLSSAVFAEEAKTIFYNFEGRVTLMRYGKGTPANFDLPFQTGDIFKIDTDSFLDITMHYLAAVKFEALSECRVVNASESEMHLDLKKGMAKANVKGLPTGTRFFLETPLGIAKVRELTPSQLAVWISKDKDGKMVCSFASKKGTLDIQAKTSSSTMVIYESQIIEIHEDGFVSAPRQVNEEEEKITDKISSVYIAPKPD